MKYITVLLISFLLTISVHHVSAQVEKGDKSPVFSATDDTNSTWDIKDYLNKKNIVIYFYPAAMTGGCTSQACGFRDNMEELKNLETVVVGISGDETENLKLFKEAENLNFPLLSDPEGKIAKQFGVPVNDGGTITKTINNEEKQLFRGVTTSRWTFIVGKDGKIVYKNTSVNASEDSNEVIKVLKKLEQG